MSAQKKRQTWYEVHPCSPERKAELMAKGYKVVDAKFAPDSVKLATAKPPAKLPKEAKPKSKKKD